MGRELTTEIHIAAPPAHVWDVLTDLPGYAAWNPFITHASGDPAEGHRLRLRMRAGDREHTVQPTVTERRDGKLLRWTGHAGVRGLFDAVHTHELVPTPTGTRYLHQERFTGLLVPLFGRTIDATETAFHAMNHALAAEVARRSVASA